MRRIDPTSRSPNHENRWRKRSILDLINNAKSRMHFQPTSLNETKMMRMISLAKLFFYVDNIVWVATNPLKKIYMKKKRMISLHTHISKSRHVVNLICTIFSQIFSTPPKLPIKPTQVCSQPVLVGRLEKRLLLPQYRNCIGHLFLAKIRNKFFQFFDVFFSGK